jgi:hypothetical protein
MMLPGRGAGQRESSGFGPAPGNAENDVIIAPIVAVSEQHRKEQKSAPEEHGPEEAVFKFAAGHAALRETRRRAREQHEIVAIDTVRAFFSSQTRAPSGSAEPTSGTARE